MSNPISVSFELAAIESYLSRVLSSVDSDYKRLVSDFESGKFESSDDATNAFFWPMASEEIALRSVFLELNALVEWELLTLLSCGIAKQSVRESLAKVRFGWDLMRSQVSQKILTQYGVVISELPGFEQAEEARRISNAYKHRKGFRAPGKDCNWNDALEKWRLERERARSCLAGVKRFLFAVLKACGKKGVTNKRALIVNL